MESLTEIINNLKLEKQTCENTWNGHKRAANVLRKDFVDEYFFLSASVGTLWLSDQQPVRVLKPLNDRRLEISLKIYDSWGGREEAPQAEKKEVWVSRAEMLLAC